MKKAATVLFGLFLSILLSILPVFAEAETETARYSPGRCSGISQVQEENKFLVDELHDEISKVISGMPSELPILLPLQENSAWKNFKIFFNSNWEKTRTRRLEPMQTWAASELSEVRNQTRTVFYPFAGPDLLTAYLLFPDAETYILVGLEPPGNLPEPETFQHKSIEAYLADIQDIMFDYFKKSYFITRKMNEELDERKINGVLPLVCIFLKRTDNIISEIKRVEFDDSGNQIESDYTVIKGRIKRPVGFKITFFKKGSARLQTVYYISCDLSDERFSPQAKFFLYLNRFDGWTCFIKSASYLLHFKNFANIRQLLLNKSNFILQDDTGIPYKYFLQKDWEIQLYGRYAKPVKDFSGVEQPDLKAAFKDKAKVKSLPFHLGYHWGTNFDCLILFKRKTKSVENSS